VPGRVAARTFEIPASGDTLPPGLVRIDVSLDAGGKESRISLAPTPNAVATLDWDGEVFYGQPLQGAQPATIRIGFVYPAVYMLAEQFERSFAALSGVPVEASESRMEISLLKEHHTTAGVWDARGWHLGGWSLDVLHAYDPTARVLYLGTGARRSGDEFADSIQRGRGLIQHIAGSLNLPPASGYDPSDDGDRANIALLNAPNDVAVAASGEVFIVDTGNRRIRKIGLDGNITTVAGNGSAAHSGDEGPATAAGIGIPSSIALDRTAASISVAGSKSAMSIQPASSRRWPAPAHRVGRETVSRRPQPALGSASAASPSAPMAPSTSSPARPRRWGSATACAVSRPTGTSSRSSTTSTSSSRTACFLPASAS